jgi:hypothetical protein
MTELISIYGTQLITGAIALFGVMLGLFWNQFFAWRKYKREQKAALNHVVFHLLELYNFVVRNDYQVFINCYLDKIDKVLGPIPKDEKTVVEAMIIGIIKQKLAALRDETEVKELSLNYEAAVKQVAYINPFMAYSLAGQSIRLQKLSRLGDYFESIKEHFESIPEQMFLKETIANFTEERLIKEICEEIKISIFEVSKRIGYVNYLKARDFFIKSEKALIEDMDEEINAIVDQIEEQIKKQSK